MWWILLDIIVVIVMFWYIRSSAKKGFAKVVLELAAFFAAYFLASTFSGMIAGWTYDHFAGEKLVSNIETELNATADATLAEALPDYLVSGAQSLGIYDDILASQRETAAETAIMLGENVARPVVTSIVRMVSSIIIFIILMFIFRLIIKVINKVFKLPIIHGLNVFLGGVLGVFKGGIVLLLACFAVSVIMMFSEGSFLIFTPENIESTFIFKYIYNINPFI